MEKGELKRWQEVCSYAAETMSFLRKTVKPEMPLVELAEKFEDRIEKKGFSSAFPISLSVGNTVAHYTPSHNDPLKAEGLIKIDMGVAKDGYLSDTASSVDLTPENRFKDLIKAGEEATKDAIKAFKIGVEFGEIGRIIEDKIASLDLVSIKNLSGHSIEKWKVHAGLIVPNYNNKDQHKITEGIYAIEPFATTGDPRVIDGGGPNIWIINKAKPVRIGREIIQFIEKEYKTLPFSSRWIAKKFGSQSLITLAKLEQQGILHHYRELTKKNKEFTTHYEHSVAALEDKTIVLTQRED